MVDSLMLSSPCSSHGWLGRHLSWQPAVLTVRPRRTLVRCDAQLRRNTRQLAIRSLNWVGKLFAILRVYLINRVCLCSIRGKCELKLDNNLETGLFYSCILPQDVVHTSCTLICSPGCHPPQIGPGSICLLPMPRRCSFGFTFESWSK